MWKSIVSVLLVLLPALYFGYVGKSVEMGLAIVAGIAAGLFLNIERIKAFKAGPSGVEAELKEVLEEAYATMANLKALARPLLLSTLDVLTRGGRWGWGASASPMKHRLVRELEEVAEALALDDPEIQEARAGFYRYQTRDRYRRFMNKMIEDKQPDTEIRDGLKALCSYGSSDFPGEAKIEELLGDLYETLEPDHIELLEDYLYYKEHHSLRREEG
jgi:hypothetical protein